MSSQNRFLSRAHNPDVLSCIANLSNDEVFTPPTLVSQMLDQLEVAWSDANDGELIWSNPSVTFLDPCTKSGVFLREIVQRLVVGQEDQENDLSERVDRILLTQIFGIGITNLTALLARRSVYCSKFADGDHSVFRSAGSSDGNIWFDRVEHDWAKGKCSFCGASEMEYARDSDLESHAYAFIHTDEPSELMRKIFGVKMNFDVVIGNPPYQLSTGGTGGAGVQAKPIYNLFVEQAKALDPRFLCMVTPSRWFSGGMGLDAYRQSMLEDSRIRVIHDFPDSNDVFPGTQIKGGVSYFLWNRDNLGDVEVRTQGQGDVLSKSVRPLLEPGADVFIRYNEGVEILRKVARFEHQSEECPLSIPEGKRFMDLVSAIGAFGLSTTFRGKEQMAPGDVKVYRNGGVGYLPRKEVSKSASAVDWWKVFIAPAGSGSDAFPHQILGRPFVGAPGTISSWTYLHLGPFQSKSESENVCQYISTRFFRFLVLLHKSTQHATKHVYTFVPKQDWSISWTDEALYSKYGITDEEVRFIESMIRPMELDDAE